MKDKLATLFGFLILVLTIFVLGAGALWVGRASYAEYSDFLSSTPANRGKAHLATISAQTAAACVPLAYGTSTSSALDEYTCRAGDKVIRCLAGPAIAEPSCKVILDLSPEAAQKAAAKPEPEPEAEGEDKPAETSPTPSKPKTGKSRGK